MQIKVLLWFDVEDYVTPESDDAFYAVLHMLRELGVRSTIKFCAKKLELLKTRGRTDILALLADHEMSFHTTDHSVHPLPTEYLEHYGFKDGAAAFEERERAGFYSIAAISGQHLTSYGQPGEAWAPQVFPVLRKWGVPTYLDAHPIVGTDGGPFWYGGILCLSRLTNLMRLDHDANGLTKLKERFDNLDPRCEATVFVSIYDHPTEFCCSEFWDEVNFAKGQNPPVLKPAPLRAPGEQELYIGMTRDFIRYSLERPNVEYITATEALRYELHRQEPITAEDVRTYAAAFDGRLDYAKIRGGWLAPSEIFSLAANLLSGRVLTPTLFYGPEAFADSVINHAEVSVAELAGAAICQYEQALGYKQLCSLYRVGNNFLNPVDMAATMLRAIKEGGQSVKVTQGTLAATRHVDETYRFGGGWVLWKDDFRGENIFTHTRLQTWTLKPAAY